jgi:hypothetical protein
MRAVPVNQSDDPLMDGLDPIRVISIFASSLVVNCAGARLRRVAAIASDAPVVVIKLRRDTDMEVDASQIQI